MGKRLIPFFAILDGKTAEFPLSASSDLSPVDLARTYAANGADGLIVFDLSVSDASHDADINTLEEICKEAQVPVMAGGRVNRLEDVKKILYTGCLAAILNAAADRTPALTKEAADRFGSDKLMLSVKEVADFIKARDVYEKNVSALIALEPVVTELARVTELPIIAALKTSEIDEAIKELQKEAVCGLTGALVNEPSCDIYRLKDFFVSSGVEMDEPKSEISWDMFKLNSDGLIPVISQDALTDEVLILAYMNEEAFNKTLRTGKMTYFSRSRQTLWTKGETSGHYQYVRSLKLDCDNDTILARVIQIGPACHTGRHSCFFQDLFEKSGPEKNARHVLDEVYKIIEDRKANPREGSYTNYLFDKGIDKILKKVGEENTEIIIAAKNPDPSEIKYEISDYLYHLMVLMVERGVTWDEIADELARR